MIKNIIILNDISNPKEVLPDELEEIKSVLRTFSDGKLRGLALSSAPKDATADELKVYRDRLELVQEIHEERLKEQEYNREGGNKLVK